MLAVYLHGLWLDNLVRSPLRRARRGVLAILPAEAVLVCIPNLDIKGASIGCREGGYVLE
jgi:hypothetical protein